MKRPLLWGLSAAVVLAIVVNQAHPAHSTLLETRPLALEASDRLLILAPHPDDEVIGCAGVIQKAVAMGLPVKIVFFTYGDSNEWSFLLYRKHPVLIPGSVRRMGLIRHDEALQAAKILGIPPGELTFLGYPDFGTLSIWDEHWGNQPAYRSIMTRVSSVPYESAFRPQAPYKGEEILQDLETIIRDFRPTKIFVAHPADYMPDHRALYLFTQVALWDLESQMQPQLFPYLVHHGRWPRPKGFHPDQDLEPPAPLVQEVSWYQDTLTKAEIDRKREALRAHQTQYFYSARYLLSFVKPNELFGDFPAILLMPSSVYAPFASEGESQLINSGEELTEKEKAAIVGLEARSIRLEHGKLILSLAFSRPLATTVKASLFLFGYRSDKPFAQMPKIHIRFSGITHAVYDQKRRLARQSIEVDRSLNQITFSVPLKLLGNPERLLISARTYLEAVPLDWVSWRVVILPKNPDGGTSVKSAY